MYSRILEGIFHFHDDDGWGLVSSEAKDLICKVIVCKKFLSILIISF